ncbi:MAG: putative hydro-lyase [Pseudomonadota bacterium]
MTQEDLIGQDVAAVRSAIRTGAYGGHTAGLCLGKLQVNLAIMPAADAAAFEEFCRLNPQPCPLVGRTDAGDPNWRDLGAIDLRTDVPSYNVYRDGALAETVQDIKALWREDLVGFALGCSFTFERALMQAGVPMPHIETDRTVPMYRTSIETRPAGPFGGGMVVSMRRIPADKVALAQQITARFPWAHGAPVHVGSPEAIGIPDIDAPDWGHPPMGMGEPVFWACGVTPQNALARARLPLCITHTPGRMLITDIDDTEDAFLPENTTPIKTEPTGEPL